MTPSNDITAVSNKLRFVNTTGNPIHLRRSEHVCQLRVLMPAISRSPFPSLPTAPWRIIPRNPHSQTILLLTWTVVCCVENTVMFTINMITSSIQSSPNTMELAMTYMQKLTWGSPHHPHPHPSTQRWLPSYNRKSL